MQNDPVLIRLLDEAEAANRAVRVYIEGAQDDLVPLKEAQQIWRCVYKTAQMRARRGAGVLKGGRWYIPRSAL